MNGNESGPAEACVMRLQEVLARLPLPPTPKWPDGVFDMDLFVSGTFSISIFAPRNVDRQTPHALDEAYVIGGGSALLYVAGRQPEMVEAGDLAYVPAGVEHHFTDMSGDFSAWVIFFEGPAQLPGSVSV